MLIDKEIHKNIKVIALDLDGTLTQHKHLIEDANKKALELLTKKYKFLMAGAGQVMRIRNLTFGYDRESIEKRQLHFEKNMDSQTLAAMLNFLQTT